METPPKATSESADPYLGLSRIFHFNINVTDMDVSLSFYTMLGFEFEPFVGGDFKGVDMTDVYGLGQPQTRMKFYHLRLPPVPQHVGYINGAQGKEPVEPTRIDLVQWVEPKAHGKPLQDLTANGIARVSLHTTKIHEWHKHLKSQGVKFLNGDKGPASFGPDILVLPFYDPDGVIIQLLQGID